MNPLTIAAIAAGAQAVTAIPSMVKSSAEKEQQKELEKLKRRQEMDALGLTQEERQAFENQLQMKTQSQFDAAQAQRNRLLQGGMGVGGGDKLLADAAMAESQGRVAAQNAQQLEMLSLEEAKKEEQLIRDLEAAQSESKLARREAMLSPITAGAGAYIGQMAPEALLKAGVKEGGDLAKEQIAIRNLMSEWGLTEGQALDQLKFLKAENPKLYQFYTNPETASYLSMVGGL